MNPPAHELSGTIRVPVLLFARYAELLGTTRLELELSVGDTVGDAVNQVRARPGAAALPSKLLVARNLSQVALDARLEPGDELALLPPLAGG